MSGRLTGPAGWQPLGCVQPLEQVDLGFSFIYGKKIQMHIVEGLLEIELGVPKGTEYHQGLGKIETLFLTVVRGTEDGNCCSNCGEQATQWASGGTDHRHAQGDVASAGIEELVS